MNVLNTKTYAGNMAIKFDIKKVWYSRDAFSCYRIWVFVFSNVFVNWIHEILLYASLSLKLMGPRIYFIIVEVVGKGDPSFVLQRISLVGGLACSFREVAFTLFFHQKAQVPISCLLWGWSYFFVKLKIEDCNFWCIYLRDMDLPLANWLVGTNQVYSLAGGLALVEGRTSKF